MRNFRSAFIGLLAFIALPAMAAEDINGRWVASLDAGQGPVELSFELKADAAGQLTGGLSIAGLPATPIKEGSVKGADATWKLDFATGESAAPITISYQGKLKGDELTVQSSFAAAPGAPPTVSDFIAKRVK